MSDKLQYVKERLEENGYNHAHGITVRTLREGYAELEMPASGLVLNPLGKVHGGAIYTLCDVAAGTAAASHGRVSVTLSAEINYLRAGDADIPVVATTRELKCGRSTAVYDIDVRQGETLIANATFTMYYITDSLEALGDDD